MDINEPTIQVGHLSHATVEDAVRSSRPMGDEHLSRSLLSTGIVDERQTPVWPEFYEGAQTRVERGRARAHCWSALRAGEFGHRAFLVGEEAIPDSPSPWVASAPN